MNAPLPAPLSQPPPPAGPLLAPPTAAPPVLPPPALGGMPGGMQMPLPPSPVTDPSSIKYLTETQQNGTVLIRVQNPDGSPGPVVHIYEPPAAKAGKSGK